MREGKCAYLHIKNWDKFQHYSDRNAPWIKLYTHVIDDYSFANLSENAKLLAFMLWVLGGKGVCSGRGVLPNDMEWIRDKCTLSNNIRQIHLDELIENGFFFASNECYQNASPSRVEENREEKKRETSSLSAIKKSIVQTYNEFASKRQGWSKCSKVPAGKNGEMLDARCRDPEWVKNFPEQMRLAIAIDWMTEGKLVTMIRPDAQRQILDGDWKSRSSTAHEQVDPKTERLIREAQAALIGGSGNGSQK